MIERRTLVDAVEALAWNAVADPSQRRLVAAAVLGFPAWQGVVRGARALDRVVAPGHRHQPVHAPVFVVGHPRSGTTFLHRLLALDPRFCAPLAWELALPAVSLHRAVALAGRAGVGRRFASKVERRLFDGLSDRHPTGWTEPEEDDWLLLQAVASPTLEYLTGEPGLTRQFWLGDLLPTATRDRVMAWYRGSVRRLLYARAPTATLLSKNPVFTGWIGTLATEFPDARFVMLVREPVDAIASHLEMVGRAWHRRTWTDLRHDRRLPGLFADSLALYRHAEQAWAALPAARRVRVRYADLVADPERAVGSVAAHFGWSVDGATRARVAEAAAEARRRVPGTPPKLRQLGIRPERVDDALRDLDPLWRALRGAA